MPPSLVAAERQQSQVLWKVLLLAALYVVFGKLGLGLAVPPGYATLLWPPSGIALGMLLTHGRALWPGVLLGSFLLNSWIAPSLTLSAPIAWEALATAFGIACGSTLQALAGWHLTKRIFGLPLNFSALRQIRNFLLLCCPLTCLIAPTAGITTLYFFNDLAPDNIADNWLSWWAGDALGIVIFLPLVLLAPGATSRIRWNNSLVNSLPFVYLIAVIIPLGLTFYGWKVVSEINYEKTLKEFEGAAQASEAALVSRIESYSYALVGGMGYFQNTPHLTRTAWNQYAMGLPISSKFPGMNGIGVISPLSCNTQQGFEQHMHNEGVANYSIHPAPNGNTPCYIIQYIYPEKDNLQALGLNIAFEDHRRAAAEEARDTGNTTLTKKITLVQDEKKSPGFLILHPVYEKDAPVLTAGQRRAAFKGWIYAPVIAEKLFEGVKGIQSNFVSLKVYDGLVEKPDALIYASADKAKTEANYTLKTRIHVMQQDWLLVWQSTPKFDRQESQENANAMFILVGGLCFSGLFGLLLFLFSMHNQQETTIRNPSFALPIAVLLFTLTATAILSQQVENHEQQYIRELTKGEIEQISATLSVEIEQYLKAITRMADRWQEANQSPNLPWLNDAKHYVQDFSALKSLGWADANGIIRAIVPADGREKYIGMSIYSDPDIHTMLTSPAPKERYIVSMPHALTEAGYNGVTVYFPLIRHGKFDGTLIALLSLDNLFSTRLADGALNNSHSFFVRYQNQMIYSQVASHEAPDWRYSKTLPIYVGTQLFNLQLVPSKDYVSNESGHLSRALLVSGVLISILLSLTIRTITITRVRSASLRKALAETKKATQAKSDFLSNISHEIRTPLNGVLATAQLLETTSLNDKQQRYIDIIRTSGETLLLLLNDVLDLSKIETGQLSLHNEPFNLHKVTTHATELFHPMAKQKQLALSLTLDPALPEWVMGDGHRYSQILTNFIGNAVKYTKEGYIKVSASQIGTKSAPALRIEVRDTGIGIPAEALAKVFDRFVQAHKHIKIEGTGLGLAICKTLVEKMGGTIGVSSEQGKGSCFWFTLPLTLHHPEQAQESTTPIVAGAYKGVHVLLAEDVATNREIICDMLEFLGCSVALATNGAEAVDYMRTQRCNLIMMDCNMPIMNGYDATRTIRAQHPDLPIIAISAHAFVQDVELCYAAGMNDYIQKPVQMAELARCLSIWGPKLTPASAPPTPTPVNPVALPDWLPKTPQRALKLIDLFRRDTTRLYDEIIQGIANHDAEAVAESAHAFKSVALQAQNNPLGECLRILEQAGRNGIWEQIAQQAEMLPKAHAELLSTLDALERHLQP